MAATGPPIMNEKIENADLAELFGIYRAELLSDALFKIFSRPTYFPELETARPCVLVGGRGTGKTTVLRCLSYEGKYVLESEDVSRIKKWKYYGFYYKVNTNSVRAFQGEELSERQWQKLFAHYLNLLLCGRLIEFLEWYRSLHPGVEELSEGQCLRFSEGLFCTLANTQEKLLVSIQQGIRRFESWVNNIDPDNLPKMSLQGALIDDVSSAVLGLPQFVGKKLFFILDEFENLLDEQQEVVNTLIKHSGPDYTFKVGVRELGWRRRSTINHSEQLQAPADYERIDIGQRLDGEQFLAFATEVCGLRAARRFPEGIDLEAMLPGLSIDEEATLLGVDAKAREALAELERTDPAAIQLVEDASDLELALLLYWAQSQRLSISQMARSRHDDSAMWKGRLHNYKVPLLFTLRGARPGVRKYYAGWRTFVLLAGGNIRYLLQLIGEALQLQRLDGGAAEGEAISPLLQTKAAIAVGGRNVKELEGLGVHGAQLTRLVLALGRLFETLALEPEGKRPEITRFNIAEGDSVSAVEPLINAGVMHLALVRRVSSQRMDLDLKSYDYAVHPIFAAFFGFSHRDMRKIQLKARDILDLMNEPKKTIRRIVGGEQRPESPLPGQLRLFESFFEHD
ncbi:ORC-CDC6 family AAA ATPase [Sphingomonas faeni]|uniref:ORC-CDC6 family AAA ATPase n=1 Tax=Sphingomonas faeni TaxID=185950 RepID=UPI003362BA14